MPNQRVRDTAKEALEALFAVQEPPNYTQQQQAGSAQLKVGWGRAPKGMGGWVCMGCPNYRQQQQAGKRCSRRGGRG